MSNYAVIIAAKGVYYEKDHCVYAYFSIITLSCYLRHLL